MSNVRFNEISPNVVSEQIAVRSIMDFDPSSQSVKFLFESKPFVQVSSDPLVYASLAGEPMYTQATLEAYVALTLGSGLVDPVTGADLSNVSNAGVLTLVKRFFDHVYNDTRGGVSTYASTLQPETQE